MTELDRAIANLKRMGVTITTTARSGEDSIAGRIQAAAERAGIAETRWNGIPIEAKRGTAVVADRPDLPLYWGRAFVGRRIAVVQVDLDGTNYGGGIDYLDDREGQGWAKVTNGGGPRFGHASVAIEPGTFVEEETP